MKRNTRLHNAVFAALAAIGLALPALAQEGGADQMKPPVEAPQLKQALGGKQYSPFVDQNFPDRVLWGVTHIHTASFRRRWTDGSHAGSRRHVPLCQGRGRHHRQRLESQIGPATGLVRHHRPCRIYGSGRSNSQWRPRAARHPDGQKMVRHVSSRAAQRPQTAGLRSFQFHRRKTRTRSTSLSSRPGLGRKPTTRPSGINQPGVFTTLHGFEWTSVPGGNNLHRTVIFRDNVDRVKQIVPFSAFDSQDPADLWKFMDRYEKLTGGQVLAIPHNGNLSNGLMYTAETYDHETHGRGPTPRRASATSRSWR